MTMIVNRNSLHRRFHRHAASAAFYRPILQQPRHADQPARQHQAKRCRRGNRRRIQSLNSAAADTQPAINKFLRKLAPAKRFKRKWSTMVNSPINPEKQVGASCRNTRRNYSQLPCRIYCLPQPNNKVNRFTFQ